MTCTYTTNGTFTVPAGVATLHVLAVGGDGAGSTYTDHAGAGGSGAALSSDFAVDGVTAIAGTSWSIAIGGTAVGMAGGANGGADGGLGPNKYPDFEPGRGGGGGGGATIVTGPPGPSPVLVVAGGGGGGGTANLVGASSSGEFLNGGDGGAAHLTGSGARNGHDGEDEGVDYAAAAGKGGADAIGGAPSQGGQSAAGENGATPFGPGGKGGHGAVFQDGYTFAGGGGGGAGYPGGGGGGGGGYMGLDYVVYGGGGGGGAAGGSVTTGANLSLAASDGTPRVVVTYTVPKHQVSVAKKGVGAGSVSSNPAGINCGSTCSAKFYQGSTVTLTATPNSTSEFAGWSGDCTNSSGACVLSSLAAAKAVTAKFNTTVTCGGLTATIVGTNGSNTITGTSGNDVISGLGGNDTIKGLGGNDIICGDSGDDKLYGGDGKDHLYGGSGAHDFCDGGSGADKASSGCNTTKST